MADTDQDADLKHGMNCPAYDSDSDCTCGLAWRKMVVRQAAEIERLNAIIREAQQTMVLYKHLEDVGSPAGPQHLVSQVVGVCNTNKNNFDKFLLAATEIERLREANTLLQFAVDECEVCHGSAVNPLQADYQQLLTVAKGLAEACEEARVEIAQGPLPSFEVVQVIDDALANFAPFDKPKDA